MMFKPHKYQQYFIYRIETTPKIAGWLDMG